MQFARSRRSVNHGAVDVATGAKRGSVVGLCGAFALLVLATLAASRGVQPFHGWTFHWAWYPTLLVLHFGYLLHTGRSPASAQLAVSLWFWSAPLWFLFEAVNFRLANWYYVFAVTGPAIRAFAAFTAFATVLPALYLVYRWAQRLGIAAGWTGPRLPLHRHLGWVVSAGLACLVLALLLPRVFFPLAWVFLTLLLEPWNYRRAPERSLLGDLEHGRYDRLVQLLVAGAAVGLLWEAFNSVAGARWIYTVPGFEGHKLFEMPLPGFLGFPVFALECFVAYQALVGAGLAAEGWASRYLKGEEPHGGLRPSSLGSRLITGVACAAAVVFGVVVSSGMSWWTIDSEYPELESLPGATAEEINDLRAAGIGSVHELVVADRPALAARGLEGGRIARMIAVAELVLLRGIGTENADALGAAGIRSPCDLARADPAVVSAAIRATRLDPHAGSPPRVRVWLRSAGRVCPPQSRASR